MSLVIYKYSVPPGVVCPHSMAKDAVVLSAGADPASGSPAVWALTDPDVEQKERRFVSYGTGWEMAASHAAGRFIGRADCGLIFHVFEVT